MIRIAHSLLGLRGRLLASSVWLLATAGAAPALAAPPVKVDVSAGPLDAALVALASQTHQQVLYAADLVADRQAPAVKGQLTPEDALQRLLKGSGITAKRTAPNVLVLEASTPRTAKTPPAGRPADRPFAEDPPPLATAQGRDAAPLTPARPPLVEALTVVGSLIRGLTDGPSPVVILSRDQLDRSGYATVAGALAALPQNFGGTTNEGLNNNGGERQATNNHFGAGLNLRGLGADATLVLVNGRRVAGAGSNGEFADISTIPTAAVERVELLLDGASALYGSDAVGGVVNIVLKRRYEGAETRLMGGVATAGEPFEQQAAQTLGGRWSGGAGLFSYEYHQRDVLHAEDRKTTRDADLRRLGGSDQRSSFAFPGNVLRPDPASGTNLPFWAIPAGQTGVGLQPADFLAGVINLRNQRVGVDVLPAQKRHSLYLTARQELTERLEVSGDLRYGYRTYGLDSGINSGLVTITPANPFFVSPSGAASHSIQYAFAELPSARAEGSAESLGASFGAEIRLWGDWRAEAYGAYSRETGKARNTGLLNTIALREALGVTPDQAETAFDPARDGYFNPFNGQASNAQAVLDYIGGGYQRFRNRATVRTLNLKADGALLSLPGGRMRLAVGAQHREETFTRIGQNYVTTPAPVAAAAVEVDRRIEAAFAELRAPLVGPDNARPGVLRLELSLAGRIERYDDFGWTGNPKVGALWSPADGLLLRASYGRSFRAPGLRELSDAPSNISSLLPSKGVRVGTLIQTGGNPDLEPETADTLTAGLEWRSASGLRISASWFDVKFKDRIDQPVRANIQTALDDPKVAVFVQRVTPAANPSDHAIVEALLADPATRTVLGGPEAYGAIVDARYVNTASLRVSGLDVSALYRRAFGANELTFEGTLTHLYRYRQQLTPTSAPVDFLGVATYPVDLRARATVDWRRGDFGAGLALNYTSAYEDALGLKIDDLATLDLQLRYTAPEASRLKGVTATLSVRNLFDARPPFYDNAAGVAYDAANASPLGRFVSLQLVKAW
ncbi:MAG: TonB-dependent receptor [Caulobacteraceae bacterium]|nr:TonB-dependent receptor [Caulobacteraceae bacterium]